ncbi:hypothetical protein [Effusibacillus dendaii]|nr:hypothetical protein [Effusibacillus dendaii]
MSKQSDSFRPFVPPDQRPPELTFMVIGTGILLAIVFGAANS